MSALLQCQEDAVRFATTREVWRTQLANTLVTAVDEELARIAEECQTGVLTRAEALHLSLNVLANAFDRIERIEDPARVGGAA